MNHVVERAAPINVILDTDIWGDIDDMLALAILHALHDRKEIDLCAVTITTDDPSCVSYVDLVSTFYRHGSIPLGIVRQGVTAQQTVRHCHSWTFQEVNYTQWISERRHADGSLVYPRRLKSSADAVEAVSLLRNTLAAQPDDSVVMVQIGYSTNLARLLDSPPDDSSSLAGIDLIQRKVRFLSVVAGTYTVAYGAPGFNVYMDVPSAQQLFERWPTPIVATGEEMARITFPAHCIEHDFNYVRDHPIAQSYRYWEFEAREPARADGRVHRFSFNWPHDHHTADLIGVLYAARPDRGYFSISKPGRITVLADGGTKFEEIATGKHYHLILDAAQEGRVLEAMKLLASQPPRS